jgi:hypothetical protein
MPDADEQALRTDLVITATVRALAASRSTALGDVAEAVGMPRSTFERRLSKGGWTAAEVARLAEWFSVPVSDLFTGLDGHLGDMAQAL